LSQPSNEHANEVFSKLLMDSLPKCCDVVVKHKKSAKKDGADAKKDKDGKDVDDEKERKMNMLKPQALKEALTTSKIQLKQDVVEKINGSSKNKIEDLKESKDISNQDLLVYQSVFD
jgi:hypothetical protein